MSELRIIRESMGISQVAMAALMSLNPKSYQIIEKHKARPIYILAAKWLQHEQAK